MSADRLAAAFSTIEAMGNDPIDVLAPLRMQFAPEPFEYRPPMDKVCPCCQRKHWDHGPTCAGCAPYWV